MPEAFYVTMSATPPSVGVLRRRLRTYLRAAILDPDTVDDLTLAASEAMENAADHAYRDDLPVGALRLTASFAAPCCDRRIVVITVSDDGAWRSEGDPGYRGRGLALIDALVAAHTVAAGGAGTSVTICHSFATDAMAVA